MRIVAASKLILMRLTLVWRITRGMREKRDTYCDQCQNAAGRRNHYGVAQNFCY